MSTVSQPFGVDLWPSPSSIIPPQFFTPWLTAFHRHRGFDPKADRTADGPIRAMLRLSFDTSELQLGEKCSVTSSETFGATIRPTLVTNTRLAIAALLLASGSFISAATKVSPPAIYSGMCDASAAVALTDRLFAVAS